MKNLLILSTLLALLAAGCATSNTPNQHAGLPLHYHNPQYGLTFLLPASWQGYSTLVESWQGDAAPADKNAEPQEHGPIILLRDPRWKSDDHYQDIPIMVFTRAQWDALHHDKFFPYAGGVIDELWHNDRYVFGLYSRYAFDEAKGLAAVGDIITRNRAANKMPHLYPE